MQRMQLHEAAEARYFEQELDGRKLLQISTFGRPTRDIPGKVSQTIQLNEESAEQLFKILKQHFGFS
ncbi:hypothetical protein BSQ44_11055 [Aquibium oceanicum]|uniref:Methionyl-tRNA formyltransferase n=2 Tax=Aquibium oceanicum TaxID=1670800 RepID=A0A1L3SYN1_9HYPH|nr:hypothetical protein BSQ44_11055 [Aquibium oceanicum]